MSDRDFRFANAESARHLRELVAALRPEDYATSVGGGWTVASVLGHTGFWDRFQAARWAEILDGGVLGPSVDLNAAEHLSNVALEPIWALVNGPAIGSIAVEAAEALDEIVANAPDAVVAQLEGTPSEYLLRRHRHRTEHIEQVERAIGGPR